MVEYGLCRLSVVFFVKQKTAYEMRISDWSSDVCSSDLVAVIAGRKRVSGVVDDVDRAAGGRQPGVLELGAVIRTPHPGAGGRGGEIGRASCRERVGQYV